MLVWSRWGGALVPLIFLTVISMVISVGENLKILLRSDPDFGAYCYLVTAVILWPLGRRLNRDVTREIIDVETGEKEIFANPHTFFFIRVEYWGIIALAISAYSFIKAG